MIISFDGPVNLEKFDDLWNIDGVGDSEAFWLNSFSAGSSNFGSLLRTNNSFSIVATTVPAINSFIFAQKLSVGATISAGQNFSSFGGFTATSYDVAGSPGINYEGWTADAGQYIGFSFNPSGTTLFGWAEIVRDGDRDYTITQWGFEESGVSIKAGDTGAEPVPFEVEGVSGMMALMGAYGVYRWKKKRRAQRKAG
ncbi:UNVERIFIED_CONTAM: hypothetical protein BEN50_04415 [Euhalothece sp. KZN 001]